VTVKEVKLINDGFFQLDMGLLVWMKPQYYGKMYRCALKSLLVLTDEERILVDTGAGELPEDRVKMYQLERERSLVEGLAELGIGARDITIVINTHLHFDHCGWNRAFENARLLVHKDELVHAHEPYRFQMRGYHRPHFEGLEFEIVDREVEVTEGVRVVPTPGHTPGHISVVVDHGSDRYIFCGDTGPLKENIEKRNVIGITTDPVQCLESIDRLRSLEGTYVYSHDNEQLEL
jgi:glyoxylase-like metal-dependent hydrolase (beta-lactamase superfamily II)